MKRWIVTMIVALILIIFAGYVWTGVCAELDRVNKFKLSEHFYLTDFQSPDTGEVKIHPRLVGICEDLFLIQPFIITSAYRTPEWNEKVGGARQSYHMRGLAVDLQPVFLGEKSMKETLILLAESANDNPDIGAIGLYRNHIHIDLRSGSSGSWYSGERKLYWVKLNSEPHWGFYYYRGEEGKEKALAHYKRYR